MSLPTLGRFVIPHVVASHFHFALGETVVDFGAGSGAFLTPLYTQVGADGTIIACEIQKTLVEKIGATARELGYNNVRVVWCDMEKANGIPLQSHLADGGILVNTLFQFENKPTAVAELRRVLRRGATLHLIDWTDSFGGLGPTPDHVITQEAAITLFEGQHFVFERDYPAGDHHYGLVFRAI